MINISPGRRFRRSLQYLLDLLFPPRCGGCQQIGYLLCPSCQTSIQPSTASRCQSYPLRLSGLCAAGSYQGPLRACIHSLKYDGNTRLAEPLGLLLAQTYQAYGVQADIIAPVPLHPERQRQRGFNQSRLLAEICAASLNIPFYDTLLTRIRPTQAQVNLTAIQRQHNMIHAFRCTNTFPAGALHARRLILIDDVCTTGATLEACAAPLFAAGALAVWGLVLARSS